MGKKFFIGTSGWNYKHWIGRFYPPELPSRSWLGFYAGYFEAVELNYSFYRWPAEKNFLSWKTDSPARFRFAVKAPRLITHHKRLTDTGKLVADFYASVRSLGRKAGPVLFQLPPGFAYNENNLARLRNFLGTLDKKKENVIEFRERGWWNHDVFQLLRREKAIFASVSGLGMPEGLIETHKTFYLRFHGRKYSGAYAEKELAEYASRLEKLRAGKIYLFFNNDAEAWAVKNALYMKELLQNKKASREGSL